MNVDITMEGNWVNFVKDTPAVLEKGMEALGQEVINTWRLSMQRTTKSGKGVKRTKSGKMHYPSEVGNPPAIDFGNLVNSLRYEYDRSEVAIHFFGADYGLVLNDTTDKGLNRPWIEDGINTVVKEKMPQIIASYLK